MRLENYVGNLLNENAFIDALAKIKSKPSKAIEKLLKKNWNDFANLVKEKVLEDDALDIINKRLGTHYTSLSKISLAKIMENTELNEDFAHYWELMKQEAFPVLAFYPALQVWLELDKMLKTNSIGSNSIKVMLVYSAIWLFLVSGKYIKSWNKWRKENPEEYAKQQAG